MHDLYAVGDRHCPVCGCVVIDLPGEGGNFECPWCVAALEMACTVDDSAISFTLKPAAE